MKPVTLAVLLFVLGSCNPAPEQKLVGKWKGEATFTDAQVDAMVKKRGETGERAAMMRQMMKNFSLDLELKADKTYEMKMMMLPIKGNWALAGRTLSLTPTEMLGVKVDEMQAAMKTNSSAKPMVFEASEQFDRLIAKETTSDQPGELVLTKSGN